MVDSASTLSEKDYWDHVLENAHLPRLNSDELYGYRITMDYIHEVLKDSKGKSFLEIGCGSSGWLPYFKKRYNLKISGLDYSKVGCSIAEENLRLQGLPFDEIYCKDFLEKDFSLPKRFNFIFSYGVVEHFKDTEEVLAIFAQLLEPGGVMITLVPNLNGLNGYVTKTLMPEIYAIHKIINNKELASFHRGIGLKVLKSNYVGTLSLAVLPFANSTNWFLRKNTFRRKAFLKLVSVLDRGFSAFFKFTGINIPSQLFSPYIICIAQNKNL
jgi:2-polyprenyl-3-methyl-5-hydroxy-6-metoxy-1,4-benzoquinol methylase